MGQPDPFVIPVTTCIYFVNIGCFYIVSFPALTFYSAFDAICKEHFDVSCPEAVVAKHVIKLPHVVFMILPRTPSIPSTRKQHCMITDLKHSATCLYCLVRCLAALRVVPDGIAKQCGSLINSPQRWAFCESRHVGAADQTLSFVSGISLEVNQRNEVYFTASGKVFPLPSFLQCIFAAFLQTQSETFPSFWNNERTLIKCERIYSKSTVNK